MKITNRKLDSIYKKMETYPAFYQKVWRACAAIPKGEVRTYGQLAAAIGHPKAARAVGQALASNPFAPVIPCHRVVGASGAMTGYSARGGIQRKISMLLAEGALLNHFSSENKARPVDTSSEIPLTTPGPSVTFMTDLGNLRSMLIQQSRGD
jgi:O-6-methylguanine DNA methyltransferase